MENALGKFGAESWDAIVTNGFSQMLGGFVHESRFLHDDNSATHEIVRASEGFASIFGCTVKDYNATGLWGGRYCPEEEVAALERANALRSGIAVHAEVRIKSTGGQSRWLYTQNRPITDPHTHRVVGVIGVGQDITNRRREERRSGSHVALDICERSAIDIHKVAYSLHHGVAQGLAGVAMLLSSAATQSDSNSVAEAIDVINQTMRDVQAMAADLSPLVAAHDGLGSALTLLVEDLRRVHSDIEIDIKLPNEHRPIAFSFNVENHLYHIAREALYNAIKHSGSSRIRLTLLTRQAETSLIVQDYGSGVAPEIVVGSRRGLQFMAQRAALMGAKLSIIGRPSQGTRIVCRLPSTTLADVY